jgi:chromate transport protein ChrA
MFFKKKYFKKRYNMIKNNKGLFGFFKPQSLVIKIILVIILSVIIVPSLMAIFPIVKYVMIAVICFFIFEIVQRSFGKNILTYLVTALILYFVVFKYLFLTTTLIIFYFFLATGVLSVFIWGTSRFSK